MTIKITKENFESEVLKSDKKVVLDFWATWCGPCKMIAPVLEELSEEREDIKIGKVDVDTEGELAVRFGVMSIPTLVFFENGEEINRVIGFHTKDELKELL